jgi:glycosidase
MMATAAKSRLGMGALAPWWMAALACLLAWTLPLPVTARDAKQRLHVSSPDWRDQVVYFLMIDRFDDGDPSNNDQGADEHDPADHRKFSGGDLRGITRRIDYIRGLGATAVWITPPVANQWWNERVRYGGYHGYWAEDFSVIDAHFGTLDDYRALSHALHTAGMYLVQDIVTNHTADFFDYGDDWREGDPAHGFRRIADSRGRLAPSQSPFSMNDATDPAQRAAGIYHWTPDIRDYADPVQERTFQLSGLDDLATDNPVVRRALRKAYGDWIREVGVDAFRIDTAFYVSPEYFHDFLHADDPLAPGILRVAEATGRAQFHAFGEGFGVDHAFGDSQARRIDGYMRAPDGARLLPGMINFPLYGSLSDVFARGAPTAVLAHRIDSMMTVHADPHRMPSFVDNHDVDRFLAGGSEAGLKQALLAILALPGIPVIYYGTEQGFMQPRQAMFAGGYGADGRDWFDTGTPLYRYLRRATELRREHRVLSRGMPTVLTSSQARAGALAWRMSGDEGMAIVAVNNSDAPTLLDNLDTGLPPGTRLRSVFSIDEAHGDVVVGADGRVSLPLGARHGEVWVPVGGAEEAPAAPTSMRIEPPVHTFFDDDFVLRGKAPANAALRVVVDGDIGSAMPVSVQADGSWQATVATADMVEAAVERRAVLWDPRTNAVSAPVAFRVERRWQPLAAIDDPAGDDSGPDGRYLPPDDAVWRTRRPLDILGLRAFGSGGALRVELRLRDIATGWNPANGFDHVAPTLFLQLPGRGCDVGSRLMPLQNAVLPGAMCWHLRLRAHGWSNALFSAEGASATSEGTPVSPGAVIAVDRDAGTIAFTFPAAALGGLRSLSGMKLYANTWDYDGRYRPLQPSPGGFAFSGGDGAVDALVMDDTAVLEVP